MNRRTFLLTSLGGAAAKPAISSIQSKAASGFEVAGWCGGLFVGTWRSLPLRLVASPVTADGSREVEKNMRLAFASNPRKDALLPGAFRITATTGRGRNIAKTDLIFQGRKLSQP